MVRRYGSLRDTSKASTVHRAISFATQTVALEDPQVEKDFIFYESVARELETQLGLKTFLPHRDVPKNLTDEGIVVHMRSIYTQVDLFIANISRCSLEARATMVLAQIFSSKVPFLTFYRVGLEIEPRLQGLLPALLHEPIEVYDNDQGTREVVKAVKNAYQN